MLVEEIIANFSSDDELDEAIANSSSDDELQRQGKRKLANYVKVKN